MSKYIEIISKLIEEQGGHVATMVLLTGVIWWVLGKYFEKCDSAHMDMKEQIDRLADENRSYRILFLKKMGLTDEDLKDIVPGFRDVE